MFPAVGMLVGAAVGAKTAMPTYASVDLAFDLAYIGQWAGLKYNKKAVRVAERNGKQGSVFLAAVKPPFYRGVCADLELPTLHDLVPQLLGVVERRPHVGRGESRILVG